ncbi:GNAT family N-acetyltransferase [Streptomyces sannanensis]|uniref:GNAT family N-acetyltransferase n=1 Tax=Streptomyces sannanensis TaxID=285536 RepID=A0ABP6SJM2_9ACTN
MDKDAVLAAYDQQMRRNAQPDGPGAVVERADGVVRQTAADSSGWNGVIWSDLDQDTADAAIAAQVEHFASAGNEFEWKLYSHDRPTDLTERLLAAGFEPEPEETLLVAEVAGLPAEAELPKGVHLLPVTDPAGVELVADVHKQAFGGNADRFKQQLLAQLSGNPDTVVAVVAMAGELPVSAARMELYPGTDFVGLWGGGTVPAWRGQGIYRALVAFRTRIAAERGYRYVQVDASEQSRPILQRLGFVPLSTTTPYLYTA